MVVRAYTVCIGVTLECRQTESEMIGDGWGHADEADEVYHDTPMAGEPLKTYHSTLSIQGLALFQFSVNSCQHFFHSPVAGKLLNIHSVWAQCPTWSSVDPEVGAQIFSLLSQNNLYNVLSITF